MRHPFARSCLRIPRFFLRIERGADAKSSKNQIEFSLYRFQKRGILLADFALGRRMSMRFLKYGFALGLIAVGFFSVGKADSSTPSRSAWELKPAKQASSRYQFAEVSFCEL
jgi:hypothetical protein